MKYKLYTNASKIFFIQEFKTHPMTFSSNTPFNIQNILANSFFISLFKIRLINDELKPAQEGS